MLTTTSTNTADIAGVTVNGVIRVPAPPTMKPVTAAAVTAMDVAAESANARMLAALQDLAGLRGDVADDEIAALERDAFDTYIAAMDLLELSPQEAFSAVEWRRFEAVASRRTRRNAQGARRRADALWGAQSVLAANVVGLMLDELLAREDGDWDIREDLAVAGLL